MASTRDGARNTEDDEGASRRVRLRLLGTVELDGPVQLRFLPERRFRLLAYLALNGSWVARDQLANLFWPDRTQDAARNNLRKLLFEVRALGVPALEDSRHALRWPVEHDVTDLSRAHAQGDHRSVLSVYRGTPLHGLDGGDSPAFATWLRSERLRLRSLWRESVLATVRDATPQTAVELSQRLLDDDPFDEDAVRMQMRALAALGRASDVTRIYRSFAERVAEEFGVDVAIETRNLERELQLEASPAPAPARGAAAPLVEGFDGFVGRSSELAELQALLADPQCRLITVTGPGGMGKSRLVKEAVRRFDGDGVDGVIWIALDDLIDVDQVVSRMCLELALLPAPSQDPVESIARHFAPRHALMVLDNAEHLPGLSGLISRFIGAAPHLKVLSTSRARIGLAGEWLLPLAGLALARSDDPTRRAGGAAAVQLFIARAKATEPHFAADPDDPCIAQLVHAVGGMPLAILLAASWVRLLPVREIAREVTRSLDVLEGAEEGEERAEHRSVRATFEQSWRLLAPREQQALAALSVMVGAFTFTAAREVAEAPLPLLASLADKSLLQTDSEGRFSLHPLIQQFAAEKLNANASDFASARTAHCRYFDHWLRHVGDGSRAEEVRLMREIEQEFGNVRAMWQFAVEARAWDTLSANAMALKRFFQLRSRWAEGAAWLDSADKALTEDPSSGRGRDEARANVWRAQSMLDWRIGATDRSAQRAERSLALCRALGIRKGIKGNLNTLGLAAWHLQQRDAAAAYFAESVAEARADGDSEAEATALGNAAVVEASRGDFAAALSLNERALALHRASKSIVSVCVTLNNLCNVLRVLQRPREALAALSEALAIMGESDVSSVRVFVLCNLSVLHSEAGQFTTALAYADQALELLASQGEPTLEPGVCHALARAHVGLGQFDEAQRRLARAVQVSLTQRRTSMALGSLVRWGCWHAARGDADRAAILLRFVLGHADSDGYDRFEAERALAALASSLSPARLVRAEATGASVTLAELGADLVAAAGANRG